MRRLKGKGGWAGWTILTFLGLTSCTWDKVEPEFCFKSEILPIFVSYCSTSGCHNPTDRTEDYDFTHYAGIMEGIERHRPGDSDIIEALEEDTDEDDHMPPMDQPQPTREQIDLIKEWVRAGAENTDRCGGMICDTAVAATYSGDIRPMIQTHCTGCHTGTAASAGLDLTDFTTVKQNAEIGRIQGAISGDPRFTPMPPNSALLPSCYVTKINQWVAAGAQEN